MRNVKLLGECGLPRVVHRLYNKIYNVLAAFLLMTVQSVSRQFSNVSQEEGNSKSDKELKSQPQEGCRDPIRTASMLNTRKGKGKKRASL